MRTMHTNSGEKVQVIGEEKDLGHGAVVEVEYSDGSTGMGYVEDLQP